MPLLAAVLALGLAFTLFYALRRRRALSEHAACRARYHALADHAADLALRLDGELRIRHANRGVCELAGVPEAQLLGRYPWQLRLAGGDCPLSRAAFEQMAAGGKEQTHEIELPGVDRPRRFSCRMVPETWGTRGALVVAHETTEERRREEDLDFQRRLMQSLAVYQNHLFLLDEEGIIRMTLEFIAHLAPFPRAITTAAGRASARRYTLVDGKFWAGDIPLDAMQGMLQKRILDERTPLYVHDGASEKGLSPPERASMEQDGVKSFFAMPIVFEDRCLGLLYAGDDHEGGVRQDLRNTMPLLASIAGIALRKAQLYDEARRNEAWYRTLLENAPDGILIYDLRACRILEINESALALFGFEEREATLRHDGHGGVPNALDRFLAAHYERFSIEARETFEAEIADGKGGVVLCEVRTVHLPGESGHVVRVSLMDLRERARLEAEKRKQSQALMQADRLVALGELSAGLAHEIAQPLSGIALASKILQQQASSDRFDAERFLRKLADVDTYIDRVRHLIEHVRTFSRDRRLEAPAPFDLREAVRGALSMVATQYANHEIALNASLGEGRLWVRGNPFELEQVVLNLLSNAKYAVERRAAAAGPDYRKRIELSARSEGARHLLEVTDNGTGIPLAARARLFEPFFTTKAVHEGTGLGLSVSYGIVQAMGGSIRIDSEEGAYTRVQIDLPDGNPP